MATTTEREVLTDRKGSKYRLAPAPVNWQRLCCECGIRGLCAAEEQTREFICGDEADDQLFYNYHQPAPTLAALAAVMEGIDAGLTEGALHPARLAYQQAVGMVEALRERSEEA